ncbi:tRNA pseudouridine(55) synthase TruB [Paradesulfitobacterium aromaticivorans]
MDGTVNVLKPPGMTSSDVVVWLRRLLKLKRVGHTGTLDPGVAGVLPVCVGQATRVAEYFTGQGKSYRAEITFGIATDTQDALGEIITRTVPNLSVQDVENILYRFQGAITQVPPMYSSVRHQGKHLYEYARAGVEVERTGREVEIYSLNLSGWRDYEFPRAFLDIKCSKGTYVRTLCHDIGEVLGCGAHMSYLLRLQSGSFALEGSWTLEELAECVGRNDYTFLRPLPEGLDLPQADLEPQRVQAFRNGLPSASQAVQGPRAEGLTVKVLSEGIFLGIGVWRKDILYPHKVLVTG